MEKTYGTSPCQLNPANALRYTVYNSQRVDARFSWGVGKFGTIVCFSPHLFVFFGTLIRHNDLLKKEVERVTFKI